MSTPCMMLIVNNVPNNSDKLNNVHTHIYTRAHTHTQHTHTHTHTHTHIHTQGVIPPGYGRNTQT